jgi:hypothetical protein
MKKTFTSLALVSLALPQSVLAGATKSGVSKNTAPSRSPVSQSPASSRVSSVSNAHAHTTPATIAPRPKTSVASDNNRVQKAPVAASKIPATNNKVAGGTIIRAMTNEELIRQKAGVSGMTYLQHVSHVRDHPITSTINYQKASKEVLGSKHKPLTTAEKTALVMHGATAVIDIAGPMKAPQKRLNPIPLPKNVDPYTMKPKK